MVLFLILLFRRQIELLDGRVLWVAPEPGSVVSHASVHVIKVRVMMRVRFRVRMSGFLGLGLELVF
jgi:hypothetical protein